MSDTNYKELPSPEFLEAVGIDGYKWAEAFMQINGHRLAELDHAVMVGWFCNSIMAMHDHIYNPIHNGDHAQYLLDKATTPVTNHGGL